MAKEEKSESRKVSIPGDLLKKIEERIEGTGFDTVSEYVTYVLREVVIEARETGEMSFTRDDIEKIRKRLKALGYME